MAKPRFRDRPPEDAVLSERETAILRGLVLGLSLREIADHLGLSRTVIEHGAMALRRRLELRNIQHLASYASTRLGGDGATDGAGRAYRRRAGDESSRVETPEGA